MEFSRSHKHPKNSWASSTPALDGERVYVVFADSARQILSAYDFEGNSVWEQNLGSFQSQHAQGTSPIVFEDMVILANDQDGPSSIVAFDKLTGHIVWNVPRKSAPQSTSYATPFIYHPKQGPPQLICSSSQSGVSALDPHTGQTIWTTKSLPQRTVASPVLAGGLFFQCCGAGGQGMLMVAVDPGGQGDVSKTRIRYTRTRLLPYVPTPVACGKYLFLWSDHGVVCCMDPATGKDVWTKRVGGDFSASPICAGENFSMSMRPATCSSSRPRRTSSSSGSLHWAIRRTPHRRLPTADSIFAHFTIWLAPPRSLRINTGVGDKSPVLFTNIQFRAIQAFSPIESSHASLARRSMSHVRRRYAGKRRSLPELPDFAE